jgi:hypothetical protein
MQDFHRPDVSPFHLSYVVVGMFKVFLESRPKSRLIFSYCINQASRNGGQR